MNESISILMRHLSFYNMYNILSNSFNFLNVWMACEQKSDINFKQTSTIKTVYTKLAYLFFF